MENEKPVKNIFENNLKIKAHSDLTSFKKEIADSIAPVLSKYDILRQKRPIDFKYYETYSSYMGIERHISLDGDTEKALNDFFTGRALAQFQEALNNFAWAVQNQQ